MLIYWDTCLALDAPDSIISTTDFARIDEQAYIVDEQQFSLHLVNANTKFYIEAFDIQSPIYGLFPTCIDPKYGFIYDCAKDIHYIFMSA